MFARNASLAFVATALIVMAVLALTTSSAFAADRGAMTAPTLTQPGGGAVVQSPRPLFRWTAPTGYDLIGVEASSRNTEDASGLFTAPEFSLALADGVMRGRVPFAQSLWSGRWYWHVVGGENGTRIDSTTRSFRIPLKVGTPVLSGRVGPRGLNSFTVKGNMNSKNYRLEVSVYTGSSRCISRTFAGVLPRKYIGVLTTYATGECTRAFVLPNRTRVRLVATAVSGNVRRSASKSFYT